MKALLDGKDVFVLLTIGLNKTDKCDRQNICPITLQIFLKATCPFKTLGYFPDGHVKYVLQICKTFHLACYVKNFRFCLEVYNFGQTSISVQLLDELLWNLLVTFKPQSK